LNIKAKTAGQMKYLEAIENNTITFGIGPAGTGKTFLAILKAIEALVSHQVQRIILTRPAIEAGERLGFLPGDLYAKVDPYLRPLFDSLNTILDVKSVAELIEDGIIEIAPLAYMRGRTLESAFIILDEAQNTTNEQMKMFLTRLGNDSKMVINGDLTQIDLPKTTPSGLEKAVQILGGVKGLEILRLTEKDVVRNRIVSEIIKAYA
jgi:phosphate starvation-inducible PhoH-like protein